MEPKKEKCPSWITSAIQLSNANGNPVWMGKDRLILEDAYEATIQFAKQIELERITHIVDRLTIYDSRTMVVEDGRVSAYIDPRKHTTGRFDYKYDLGPVADFLTFFEMIRRGTISARIVPVSEPPLFTDLATGEREVSK